MPQNTNRNLHDSIVTVRVDDDSSRSNYTIHVEHPEEPQGTRCFHRNNRDMVVSGVRKHLNRLTDSGIARVEVLDNAALALGEAELRPESYERTGAFAPDTPRVEVNA